MLQSPLIHPLAIPLLQTLTATFGVGLAGIALASGLNPRRMMTSSLFRRWRTWLMIAPVFAIAVLSGPLTVLALALVLALQGLREYSALVELPGLYRRVLLIMAIAVLPLAVVSYDLYLALPPLLLILATLQPLLTQDVQTGARHLAFAALGFAYLPWLLGFLVLTMVRLPGGDGLLLLIGFSVGLSDVGAFCVGSLLGRHRLSPILSPSKTWEGVLGNVLGAALGCGLLWFAFPSWLPDTARLGVPLVIALAALWGDLVESLLKRAFAVKDAGSWLPGFGGLLDRIDSLLLAVPLTYYYCGSVGWIIGR